MGVEVRNFGTNNLFLFEGGWVCVTVSKTRVDDTRAEVCLSAKKIHPSENLLPNHVSSYRVAWNTRSMIMLYCDMMYVGQDKERPHGGESNRSSLIAN